MRYVPGGDVGTLVRREGPLPVARAAAIISAMASALDAAHAAGLVHRDVKPANMLLDARPGRPDHAYLTDFGLTKGPLSSARAESEFRDVLPHLERKLGSDHPDTLTAAALAG